MAKLIVLILGGWLIYQLLKGYHHKLSDQAQPREKQQDDDQDDDMVQCAYCGVYVPKAESVQVNAQHYCSQAHATKQP